MERRKKITIILILMFVHVFVGIHVYFCPERSIIFGRVKTIANMVTEIKRNPNEHKNPSIPEAQPLYFYLLLLRFGKAKITIFIQKIS